MLVDQPGARECDLVVKGITDGAARGWLLDAASGRFRGDRAAEPPLDAAALRALAQRAGQEQTWTCVPPGEGTRLALDRDGDGYFDRDELDAGSDPANPQSTPDTSVTPTPTTAVTPTATPPLLGCPGDCDGNADITVDELVRGIAIALGSQPIDDCRNLDRNNDGAVTIDELTRAVRTLFDGCELTPPAE